MPYTTQVLQSSGDTIPLRMQISPERSYRARFGENPVTEVAGKIARSEQIDRRAEEVLQVLLQAAQVEQRRAGQRIDEDVYIAVASIGTTQDRAEQPQIGRAMAAHQTPDRGPAGFDELGQRHVGNSMG